MTRIHVTLPAAGPGRPVLPTFVTDRRPPRRNPHDWVGPAADLAGLDGVLVPFDPAGLDSLVVAGALLRSTRRAQVVAGFHPGIATPVYAAKLSATLQRFSHDRLGWHLTVAPDRPGAYGDFLSETERFERADEFLTVARGVWHETDYTFEGRFYEVLGGGLRFPLSAAGFPRVHLDGTSDAALELSARHADVHLLAPDEDPALVPPGVTRARRVKVLAREDDDEARRDAQRIGFDGLIGSYEAVAAAIHADQVDEVFLEVPDGPGEVYRIGEHLLPLLSEEAAHVG